MKSFASDFAPRAVINASGTMTTLGACVVNENSIVAATDIMRKFVEMPELHRGASISISSVCGAEAGCVTACVASGITLAVAATMTGDDIAKIEALPNVSGLKSEVILQKGHDCYFSGQISQMIRLSGANVKEIGAINRSMRYQLEGAINENTAAALYVVSHQTSQTNMIDLNEFIEVCHARNIPVIVDASAEYNLTRYVAQGADLVLYSAHKFLGGLTAGIVAGRKDLVRACYLQEQGIGRAMKVGKEGVASTVAALHRWQNLDRTALQKQELLRSEKARDFLEKNTDVLVVLEVDPTGNPVTRVRLKFDPDSTKTTVKSLSRFLAHADPAIYVRAHDTDPNSLLLDPCNLTDDEMQYVAEKISWAYSLPECSNSEREIQMPPNENLVNWPDPPPEPFTH